MPYRKATIRPFSEADESVLFSLAREVFGAVPTWDDRRTIEALESDIVFVAEVESRPAGYVALVEEDDRVCIEHLLVSPGHDDEEIGRQLVEYAEGYAISRRAGALRVVVEGDNRPALAFYRARGFAGTGPDLLELALPKG